MLDIFIGHIKIHALSAYKGNSEFEILLVKTFSLEKTQNQIIPAPIERIKFLFFKKTVYGPFSTRSIFRSLTYSEPWFDQRPGIFRTLAYLKFEAYSEHCQTSTISVLRK